MSGSCNECGNVMCVCELVKVEINDSNLASLNKHMGKLWQLEEQLSDLQEKYDRAVEVILLSKSTIHLSKSSIGHEEYCDKLEEFLKSIESSEVQFEPCGKCLCKCACEEEENE